LEYYLGSQQITHAADTLNSYCQSILGEVVKANEEAWEKIKNSFKFKDREVAATAFFQHRAGDGSVREALRDKLKCFWSPESDVVAKLRNKLVHQNGHDPEREVEKEIDSKNGQWCPIMPPMWIGKSIPVRYDAGDWLAADAEIGLWANSHVRHHIHLMDQNLCHVYSLPRERWVPRTVSRKIASTPLSNSYRGIAPGQSLSSLESTMSTSTPQQNVQPNDASSPYPKPSDEEIACAKRWHSSGKSLSDFVTDYAAKLNLRTIGRANRLAGVILSHTRRGHDCHFEWTFVPNDSDDEGNPEIVSIRLRQKEFKPFITIWGTRSEMRDFEDTGEHAAVLEYLKDCIDKTLTG